jgi:hypothetical protein
MTIECTIRFTNPAAAAEHFIGTILTIDEIEGLRGLVGGFYFPTNRSALTILTAIDAEGFDTDDFETIEFKMV